MFVSHVAAHPASSAATLETLGQHLLADDSARHTALQRHVALRGNLLQNPATPAAVTAELLARWPDLVAVAMNRPGIDPGPAIAAAVATERTCLVRAVRADRTGLLAALACEYVNTRAMWLAALVGDHTPAAVQRVAASRLAAQPAPETADRQAVLAAVATHPEWAAGLAQVACPGSLLDSLREVDHEHRATYVPGTRPWYRSAAADPTTVLRYLAAHPDMLEWEEALTRARDPHAELATAAHLAHPSDPRLASHLIRTADAAPDMVRSALLVVAAAGDLTGFQRATAATHLASGPLTFICAYAPYVQIAVELDALLTRTDLSSATLDVLTAGVLSTGVKLDPWHHLSSRNPTIWGALLAAHPCATPTQQLQGLAMAMSPRPAHTGPVRDRGRALTARCTSLAQAAQMLPTAGAARAGGALPLEVVNDLYLGSSTAVVTLVRAVLDDVAPLLGAPGVLRSLVALVPGFTGTVAELLGTAFALAAPCEPSPATGDRCHGHTPRRARDAHRATALAT